MTEIKITPVNKKDTQKVIKVLFAAFEQDPLMYYFFGNEYQNLAKYVMQYLCNLAHLTKLPILSAFIEEELKGVALITPPKVAKQDRQKAIALADEQLAIALGETVIIRIEAYFQIMEANKPKQPHFYIDILGVIVIPINFRRLICHGSQRSEVRSQMVYGDSGSLYYSSGFYLE